MDNPNLNETIDNDHNEETIQNKKVKLRQLGVDNIVSFNNRDKIIDKLSNDFIKISNKNGILVQFIKDELLFMNLKEVRKTLRDKNSIKKVTNFVSYKVRSDEDQEFILRNFFFSKQEDKIILLSTKHDVLVCSLQNIITEEKQPECKKLTIQKEIKGLNLTINDSLLVTMIDGKMVEYNLESLEMVRDSQYSKYEEVEMVDCCSLDNNTQIVLIVTKQEILLLKSGADIKETRIKVDKTEFEKIYYVKIINEESFCVVYGANTNGEYKDRIFVYTITENSKTALVKMNQDIFDKFNGVKNEPKYKMQILRDVGDFEYIVLAICNYASEVYSLAKLKKSQRPQKLEIDEGFSVYMPISRIEDYEDTFTMDLALDFCSNTQVEKPNDFNTDDEFISACPILFFVNCDASIIAYDLIINDLINDKSFANHMLDCDYVLADKILSSHALPSSETTTDGSILNNNVSQTPQTKSNDDLVKNIEEPKTTDTSHQSTTTTVQDNLVADEPDVPENKETIPSESNKTVPLFGQSFSPITAPTSKHPLPGFLGTSETNKLEIPEKKEIPLTEPTKKFPLFGESFMSSTTQQSKPTASFLGTSDATSLLLNNNMFKSSIFTSNNQPLVNDKSNTNETAINKNEKNTNSYGDKTQHSDKNIPSFNKFLNPPNPNAETINVNPTTVLENDNIVVEDSPEILRIRNEIKEIKKEKDNLENDKKQQQINERKSLFDNIKQTVHEMKQIEEEMDNQFIKIDFNTIETIKNKHVQIMEYSSLNIHQMLPLLNKYSQLLQGFFNIDKFILTKEYEQSILKNIEDLYSQKQLMDRKKHLFKLFHKDFLQKDRTKSIQLILDFIKSTSSLELELERLKSLRQLENGNLSFSLNKADKIDKVKQDLSAKMKTMFNAKSKKLKNFKSFNKKQI